MIKSTDRFRGWVTLSWLSTVVFLFSCGSDSQLKALDKRSVRDEVTQMLHDYHDAIRAQGLLAEFDYLDDSDDFFWIPPSYESALSYDSVKAILEQNALSTVSADLQWDTLWVYPLTPSLASFHGIVSGEMVSRDDPPGTTRSIKMIESGTIIRRAGRWWLLSGQTRSLLSEDVAAPDVVPQVIPMDSTFLPSPIEQEGERPGDSVNVGVRSL